MAKVKVQRKQQDQEQKKLIEQERIVRNSKKQIEASYPNLTEEQKSMLYSAQTPEDIQKVSNQIKSDINKEAS